MDVLARVEELLPVSEGWIYSYQRSGRYEVAQLINPETKKICYEYKGIDHPDGVCEGNPCRWCGYTFHE